MELLGEYSKLPSKHATDIENLCLDFTYPGYPKLELIAKGKKTDVTSANLTDYIERVIDLTLGKGIEDQVIAFRDGFNVVFPISDLSIFNDEEKVSLIGGSNKENWDISGKYSIKNCLFILQSFTNHSKLITDLHSLHPSYTI